MTQKGYKVDPHFQKIVTLINMAAGHNDLGSQAFDNLISTLSKSVELSSPKQVVSFIQASTQVLEKQLLYYSS